MSARWTDAEDTREHFVYRLFNDDDDLLYIGCTSDIDMRLQLHHVPGASTYELETHPTKAQARSAERSAIEAEAPLLNKQHNRKRFKPTGGGKFEPVEPVHPLTAAMIERDSRVVTLEDQYEAWAKVGAMLGLFGGGAA